MTHTPLPGSVWCPATSRTVWKLGRMAPRVGRRSLSSQHSRGVGRCPHPVGIKIRGVVPIRVVLAEDSVAVRDVLVELLNRSAEIELVATADDEPTLLAAIGETWPDVVVTDIRMPPTRTDEGVRVAERLATAQPDIGVVILGQYSDPQWIVRALGVGGANRGWVMKERAHSAGQLVTAVKTVHQGDRWIDPAVAAPE
jgi:DNA-binding NarL/FixJ family response regulator